MTVEHAGAGASVSIESAAEGLGPAICKENAMNHVQHILKNRLPPPVLEFLNETAVKHDVTLKIKWDDDDDEYLDDDDANEVQADEILEDASEMFYGQGIEIFIKGKVAWGSIAWSLNEDTTEGSTVTMKYFDSWPRQEENCH